MSQTLDTNVLLYASNDGAPEQERALALLRHLVAGPDLVVLLWPALIGYLRIATHPAVFARPLSHADAVANLDQLMSHPHMRVAGEHERFWSIYQQVTTETPARANGVPDAHLVALMLEHGISTIWSRDRDFLKYPMIQAEDPFSDRYRHGFDRRPPTPKRRR